MITRAVVTDDGAVEALDNVATGAPLVIGNALDKISLLVGRKVEATASARLGDGRLSHSLFLGSPPIIVGPYSRILAENAVWYASIHEYGGVIEAKHEPYLTFPTDDGGWARVKRVEISEKRFVRDSLDEFDRTGEASMIMAVDLGRLFSRRLV